MHSKGTQGPRDFKNWGEEIIRGVNIQPRRLQATSSEGSKQGRRFRDGLRCSHNYIKSLVAVWLAPEARILAPASMVLELVTWDVPADAPEEVARATEAVSDIARLPAAAV